MEVLLVLIGLVVLGVMAYGVIGFLFLGWASNADYKAKENAPDTLDRLFDRSEADVAYKTGIGQMAFEDVVIGAKRRGYELTHQSGDPRAQTLIFSRAEMSREAELELRRERLAKERQQRQQQEAERNRKQRSNSIGALVVGIIMLIAAFLVYQEVAFFVTFGLIGVSLVAFGAYRLSQSRSS